MIAEISRRNVGATAGRTYPGGILWLLCSKAVDILLIIILIAGILLIIAVILLIVAVSLLIVAVILLVLLVVSHILSKHSLSSLVFFCCVGCRRSLKISVREGLYTVYKGDQAEYQNGNVHYNTCPHGYLYKVIDIS